MRMVSTWAIAEGFWEEEVPARLLVGGVRRGFLDQQ